MINHSVWRVCPFDSCRPCQYQTKLTHVMFFFSHLIFRSTRLHNGGGGIIRLLNSTILSRFEPTNQQPDFSARRKKLSKERSGIKCVRVCRRTRCRQAQLQRRQRWDIDFRNITSKPLSTLAVVVTAVCYPMHHYKVFT